MEKGVAIAVHIQCTKTVDRQKLTTQYVSEERTAHVLDHGCMPTRKADVLKPKATNASTDAGMCGSARSGSRKKLGIAQPPATYTEITEP